jgi:hypothetical protein
MTRPSARIVLAAVVVLALAVLYAWAMRGAPLLPPPPPD